MLQDIETAAGTHPYLGLSPLRRGKKRFGEEAGSFTRARGKAGMGVLAAEMVEQAHSRRGLLTPVSFAKGNGVRMRRRRWQDLTIAAGANPYLPTSFPFAKG